MTVEIGKVLQLTQGVYTVTYTVLEWELGWGWLQGSIWVTQGT